MPATWKRIITTADDANYKNSNVSAQTLSISGKTLSVSSGNSITLPTDNNHLTSVRQTGADSTPAGTQFNNAFIAPASSTRSVYFTGSAGTSSVSTWYGSGNKPYSAIDVGQSYMSFWTNNSSGTWYRMMEIHGDHTKIVSRVKHEFEDVEIAQDLEVEGSSTFKDEVQFDEATNGIQYSDISGTPTAITNNNQLTNGRGFTTNVGDITNVSTGTGLTGGGSSGSVTVSVASGGIDTTQLADDSVTKAKLDSNSVVAGSISTTSAPSQYQVLSHAPTGDGLFWNYINNNYWSGTDLSVANGGTGASSSATARGKNNLDVNQAGHLGYVDRIKILPSDFMPDSDNSTANYALTSANNGGTGRIMSSLLEIIGNWNIPKGFKATSVTLYGTSRSFAVYECNITNTTATSKGTGTMSTSGGTSNITDVTATTTNYLSIRIDLASTNDRFYGGYISITRA